MQKPNHSLEKSNLHHLSDAGAFMFMLWQHCKANTIGEEQLDSEITQQIKIQIAVYYEVGSPVPWNSRWGTRAQNDGSEASNLHVASRQHSLHPHPAVRCP